LRFEGNTAKWKTTRSLRARASSRTAQEVAATEDAREISPDDVCVLIPTLDEATTIADVIEGFYEQQGYTNVVIVDGNSTDGTREIAREHGAEVLVQSGDGKGQAVREALEYVTVPYVLMADGDGTYDPADADKMVEPLSRGYEHVIGNRFAEMDDDAMRALNGFGNRMINRAFGFVHGANYEDILSGYRAFTVESFERLSLDSDGFTIETELAVDASNTASRRRSSRSVTALGPTSPKPTSTRSQTAERSCSRCTRWQRPTTPCSTSAVSGSPVSFRAVSFAVYVLWEWVQYTQSHEVMALASAAAILLGVQLLMFGVLSDMLVTLHHREQRRRLERIARESNDE